MAMLTAMTTAASMFPSNVYAKEQEEGIPDNANLDRKKGPYKFSGVGCGILVGTERGKAVAVVKGDPDCNVNKALLCVTDYHQIMCLQSKGRLTHALVKQTKAM